MFLKNNILRFIVVFLSIFWASNILAKCVTSPDVKKLDDVCKKLIEQSCTSKYWFKFNSSVYPAKDRNKDTPEGQALDKMQRLCQWRLSTGILKKFPASCRKNELFAANLDAFCEKQKQKDLKF